MQTLVVRSVYCQLISVLSGYFGRLFAPEVAAHSLSSHQLTGSGYVNSGLSPFVCLKFGHLPVLLLVLDYYCLARLLRPFRF